MGSLLLFINECDLLGLVVISYSGIMDKNVAFFGYIASNGQKCCSFLDRYLDNTKTTLPLPYLYKRK